MAERTSYDLEVKRRLDEAECSTRFRAEPIPPETMLPLYEKQEREKEAARAKRVADRFQFLQEMSDLDVSVSVAAEDVWYILEQNEDLWELFFEDETIYCL